MGNELRARCDCGYERTVEAGSSMENYGSSLPFPHICPTCAELVIADILDTSAACPLCGETSLERYGSIVSNTPPKRSWFQKIFSDKEPHYVPTVFDENCPPLNSTVIIEHGKHKCPKCSQRGLKFEVTAWFD
jgi:hypothetical protein